MAAVVVNPGDDGAMGADPIPPPLSPAAVVAACGMVVPIGTMGALKGLVARWAFFLHPSNWGLTKYMTNKATPMRTGTSTPKVAPAMTPGLVPLPPEVLPLPLPAVEAKTGLLTLTPAYPAATNEALAAAIVEGLFRLAVRAEVLAVALLAM